MGASIDFSTNVDAAAWQVSSDGGLSYIPNTSVNSVSPGILGTPGVWQGLFEFFLPADIASAEMSIFNLVVDDRIVMSLNGNIIPGADAVIFGNGGVGIHDFGDGAGSVAYDFVGSPRWKQPDPYQVVVSSGFIFGGTNQLIAYVNNTGTGNPTAQPTNAGLSTAFGISGSITTSKVEKKLSIPEFSSAMSLLGLGIFGLLMSIIKSRPTA
jgi:hypothetical protein